MDENSVTVNILRIYEILKKHRVGSLKSYIGGLVVGRIKIGSLLFWGEFLSYLCCSIYL